MRPLSLSMPTPHVVIVDDDSSILTLLGSALRAGLGARVTPFASGEAALAGWNSFESVHLLLTDYSMPSMNGLELATRVRALDGALPIVVLSAVDVPIQAPGVVTRFLSKPCPPRVLLPELRALLAVEAPSAMSASRAANDTTPRALLELKARYVEHLGEVLAGLDALVAALPTPEGERALRDALHRLAGTAGSYGFRDITEAALSLRGAIVAHQPTHGAVAELKASIERARAA